MADHKDILPDNSSEFNEEELMQFLQQPQEADDAFARDAQEGLNAFDGNDKLQQYVLQLNQNLQQQLHTRKQHKEKRQIRHLSGPILALLIILTLCVLAYAIIRLYY